VGRRGGAHLGLRPRLVWVGPSALGFVARGLIEGRWPSLVWGRAFGPFGEVAGLGRGGRAWERWRGLGRVGVSGRWRGLGNGVMLVR
jgi:hypothetical protein